jgi:hypothetical protein
LPKVLARKIHRVFHVVDDGGPVVAPLDVAATVLTQSSAEIRVVAEQVECRFELGESGVGKCTASPSCLACEYL